MSTEHQMWNFMRPRIAPYGRAVRIENPAGPGTPDVYYRFKLSDGYKFSGWLELKHLDEPPVKHDTPLRFERLTLEQVTWLEEEDGIGGRAHMFFRCGSAYTLIKPGVVRMVFNASLSYYQTVRRSVYHSEKFFSPAELVRCLRSK